MVVVAGVLALVGGLNASGVEPQDSKQPVAEPNRKAQLLVTTSGRAIEGDVVPSGDGVMLYRSGGGVFLHKNQIRCIASDFKDAYFKQRDSMRLPSADDHCDLAKWCITYHQYNFAREELRRALKKAPGHAGARQMLLQIEEVLDRPKETPAATYAARQDKTSVDAESLGGLSRETAAVFTTKIQPLLKHKCGNASCHGPNTDQQFRLQAPGPVNQGHRVFSERNLSAILKEIDLLDPEQSRLLVKGRQAHGGTNGSPFSGPGGQGQWERLVAWVGMVAAEKGGPSRNARSRLAREDLVQAELANKQAHLFEEPIEESAAGETGKQSNMGRRPAADSVSSATLDAASSELTGEEESDRLAALLAQFPDGRSQQRSIEEEEAEKPISEQELQQVYEESRPDAFDPDIFNRRYHGREAATRPQQVGSPGPVPKAMPSKAAASGNRRMP